MKTILAKLFGDVKHLVRLSGHLGIDRPKKGNVHPELKLEKGLDSDLSLGR